MRRQRMNNDLISRSALKEEFAKHEDRKGYLIGDWEEFIDNAPTVERPKSEFTIDELTMWLNEIVFYNSKNDLGQACLEIIGRLDGFERFVADMRKEAENEN